MRFLVFTLALACGLQLVPSLATAADAKEAQRTRITLNTSAQGLETHAAATAVSVAVRLHSGNFDFLSAKEDGSDLRVFAGDDKTPLKFSIERFDSLNELAVLWVQVPTVAPGSEKNNLYVHAGDAKPSAEAPGTGGFDPATLVAIHFSDKDALGTDAIGDLKTAGKIAIEPNGLLAGSAVLNGAAVVWPGVDKVKVEAGGAVTLSMWFKPEVVTNGTLLKWGPLSLELQGGKLQGHVGAVVITDGEVPLQAWTQAALTVGAGKATLYVNGVETAHADAQLPAVSGALQMGEGVKGLADEIQLASTARSADWLRVAAGAQGAESKLVASVKDNGAEAEGSSPGYFGILVKNLTTDAWAIIIILALMFALACWVVVTKTMFVMRADKDNRRFLARFRVASLDLLHLEKGAVHPDSSLFRLYAAGVRELAKREIGGDNPDAVRPLSGASLDAVKASIDADLVRESHRLNSAMVVLTIAISGGPFLGLLGTVVGVMVTFAAIAAAGDVNVNAIAPGIASALLATVAGLAVAIPSLFAYNYLASRIKNISADMQIFVDEFVTRVAETYGRALRRKSDMSADVKDDNQPYDEINVTPMLDLAYVLLVVFIILTTASVQGVKVNSPTTDAANNLARPQTRAITITADGAMYLDAYPVTIDQLRTSLAQYKSANPALPVVLKADSAAQYDKVMEVLEVAKRLDINEIGLVTKRQSQ